MVETTEEYRNRINQLKTSIENEPYIQKMRENIAEGISKTGNRQADIEIRQDKLEGDFVAVQQDARSNTPSGAELAVATGEYNTLGERLDAEQNKVNAQLAQTNLVNTNKTKKPMVSFICDDGAISDMEKLLPIIREKNFPVGIAVITDWVGKYEMNTQFMTWEQLKEFADAGSEILSHSTQQQHLMELSDVELEHALKVSRDTLVEKGYHSDLIAYPYGENDERVRSIVRKYYRAGFGIVGDTNTANSNAAELFQFNIARVGVGSSYDQPTEGFPNDTTSLEYYKARVDEAIEHDSWVVFMLHTSGALNSLQQQHLRDLVDYIRSKNVEIKKPSDALNEKGNFIDVGEKTGDYFKITSDGELKTNLNDFQSLSISEINSKDFGTYVKLFDYGLTLIPISTQLATSHTNSPIALGGVLYNYRVSVSQDFNHQKYVTVNGDIFVRNVNSDGTYTQWKRQTVLSLDVTIPSLTIPANNTYNHIIPSSHVKNNSMLSVYPKTNIETGLLYSVFAVNNKDVVIRFANITSAPIVTTSRGWTINVH